MVLAQARGCGFTPGEQKGEGEACTRSSECDVLLECRGGVCMRERPDAGMDAGRLEPRFDAGLDAATDVDADVADAATDVDADLDATVPDDAGEPLDGDTL